MTPDDLQAACLDLNAVVETFPFDGETSVFKVADRMFALSALDAAPLSVSLKCDPDRAVQLRDRYRAISGGYHLNKRHWNTVVLDGSVPDRLVREMIEDSYDLVVAGLPRHRQLQLDWPAARPDETG